MNEPSLRASKRKIGDLDCTVVDSSDDKESIDAVVILCHGFGASGEDLVPCAHELQAHNAGRSVRYVFPAAPIELEPGGYYDSRAWWPIDMEQLQIMMMTGEIRDLRKDKPEMLDERYDQLLEVVNALQSELDLATDKIVLGGFSQGAMLSTHTALRMESSPGGLIVWSGTLLNESEWREFATKRKGLKVVQSHGQIDPILPYVAAEWLKDFFLEFEMDAAFYPFMGQHAISGEAIAKASELIDDVISEY